MRLSAAKVSPHKDSCDKMKHPFAEIYFVQMGVFVCNDLLSYNRAVIAAALSYFRMASTLLYFHG
jgi:hypothetical protein